MHRLNQCDRQKMKQTSDCCWGLFSCFRVFDPAEETDPDEVSNQAQLSLKPEAVCVQQPTFSFCSPRRLLPFANQGDSYDDLGDVIEQDCDLSDEAEKALEAERKLKLSRQPEPKPPSPPPPPPPEERLTRSLQQISRRQCAPIAPECIREDKHASARHLHFPNVNLPFTSTIPYDIPKTLASKGARHNRHRTSSLRPQQEAGLLKRTTLPPTITETPMQLYRTGAFRRKTLPAINITIPLQTSWTPSDITITEPLSLPPSPPAITVTEQQLAPPMPPTSPPVTVDNKQAAPQKPTSIGSRSTLNKPFQRFSRARFTRASKWLKKQCVTLAHLVVGSPPDISQETDNNSSNTYRESNELLRMVAHYNAREQAHLQLNPVFAKVSAQCVPGLTIDEQLADRNEPRRLRKTRSAPSLVNGQEMTCKSRPIWPSLNDLLKVFWSDSRLSQNDYQRAWVEWWNWRSKLYSIPYSNTLESPNNYTRSSKKHYLKGKFVKQLGDVGGKKRVVTTTRAENPSSVSTDNYTSALLATSYSPSTSALLSPSTFPSTSGLPSTSELPSGRVLPSTSALPTTSALSTTSTDETAQPKSIKGKSGKHPAKGTKHANQNLSENVLCKNPRDYDS